MDAQVSVGSEALPMKVTLITPTCDRPEAIRLCEMYVARQSYPIHQWIVADGGQVSAVLTMGQEHIHDPKPPGPMNLVNNIRNAIPKITGDVVVFMEDDDSYTDNHVEVCVRKLHGYQAAGCIWLNYYNIKFQAWRRIRNTCAALCNTALKSSQLHLLSAACDEAERREIYHVDRLFWNRIRKGNLHSQETVTGIKGVAGSPGIGIGHKTSGRWINDLDGSKLREWIGEDARYYV